MTPQTAECFVSDIPSTELIRKHYRMQHGRMISRCEDLPHGIAVHSDVSTVSMWNHSAWFGGSHDALLEFAKKGEAASLRRNRRPAFYLISSDHEPLGGTDTFAEWGYEWFDRESWMIYTRATPPELNGSSLSVLQAQTPQQIDQFVDVFAAAFQIRDSAFIELLRHQALDPQHAAHVRHFIGYSGGKPGCVGTLISSGSACCIYNVGTVPGARNRGYGSALITHLLNHASAQQPVVVFLQTAQGSAAERLYLRHGFNVAFVRHGFRLKTWPIHHRTRTKLGHTIHRINALSPSPNSFSATATNNGPRCKSELFTLPHALLSDLRALAHRANVSLETIIISACVSFLARQTRDESIRLGIRSGDSRNGSSRDHFLPLTVTAPTSEPIQSWLQTLEQQRLNIRSATALPADSSWEFLIDFTKPTRKERIEFGPVLAASFAEPDPARFRILYDPAHFDRDQARQTGRRLTFLLEQTAEQPHAPTSSLKILTAREQQELLAACSGPVSADPALFCSVAQLFEQQAARSPHALALLYKVDPSSAEFKTFTYTELNARANQLASHLRALGVGPETYVGLCLDESVDRIVSLLAVLKSGGSTVPLDPDQPADRLAFVIHDTGMPLLITTSRRASLLQTAKTNVLCIDSAAPEIAEKETANLQSNTSPEDTAYIIYTSGSTGAPKGVLVSHGAIASHCLDARAHYELTARDRVLQFASFHFDAALEQILPPLLAGATVVLRGPEMWKPADFNSYAEHAGLTVVDLPTAYWHQLVKHWAETPDSIQPHSLRLIIVGGEAMLPETVRLWRQTPLRHLRLLNAYGPTEATITATTFELNGWMPPNEMPYAPVPIGRPRAHRIIYVLDRYGHLAPVGIPGELCIGGDLLARGYLNRAELTREKFVPDPFRRPGARLYRTGDLARYLPDGNLEFLGRLDDQVKVRGFRIELGEIETTLTQHARVESAVVLAREVRPGEKILVAYVVPEPKQPPTESDLRYYLKQKLPEYMVPSSIVMLQALPLTASGKVDRRALPEPQLAHVAQMPASSAIKGPSTPTELRVLLLFEKVLNRRPIGVDASFFELGGDSLQALELIVAIERAIGRSVPLETLFQSSTVEGLARILHDPNAPSATSALVPLQPHGSRPPLFLIHTTPGDVLGYGNLVFHFDPDQPCYGIQSRGLVRPEETDDSIERMASFYIEQIRTVQPTGPYYLGGWCYGGIVAVEMAHQLLQENQTIALLALFETLAPPPPWRVTEYYRRRLRCFFRMPARRWATYFKQKLKYLADFKIGTATRFQRLGWGDADASGAIDYSKLAQLQHVYEQNLKALKRYRSWPYPGRVSLFNAEHLDEGMIPDRYYGWYGLAEQIEIHTVPGTHDSMLAEPHVAVLAQKLDAVLRRTQNLSKRPNRLLLPLNTGTNGQ